VDHVAITVKDMTRSIKFYTEKLGFTITRSSETPNMKTVFPVYKIIIIEYPKT